MEGIKKVWDRQLEFNKSLGNVPKDIKDKQALTKEFVLHLITEATELLNEVNWKMHRKAVYDKHNPISESNIREEIIDVFKYIISIAQFWGMSSEDFIKEFERKSEVVEQRYQQEKVLNLMKDKNIVAIDIDGVLCEYPIGFVKFIEKEKGIKIGKVFTYDMYSEIGAIIGEEEVRRLKHKFRETGEKQYLDAIPGGKEVLDKIKSEGTKIILLSARPVKKYTRIFGDTIEWLKKNEIPYDAIIWDEKKEDKILNEFPNIKFMVEDHPKNALKIAEAGYQVFLINAPYNIHVMHENIMRVDGWEDINKVLTAWKN